MFGLDNKGIALIYDGDKRITYESVRGFIKELDELFIACLGRDYRRLAAIKTEVSPWAIILYVYCIKRRIPVMLWSSEQEKNNEKNM